ncbi:MAG: hypothetical protein H8E40_03255 [Chloroflexi bacterium]|nr:hypothetical protein [Chloroflexota bacterium]
MERYKAAVRSERNIQPLSDDYIKFIRFAHDRIERSGFGIIGMITNHTYLSGLVHRGMREELVKSFSTIYILDLHGSSLIGEKTPNGSKDENVFDIMQGVAIVLFVRESDNHGLSKVYHADVWGTREEKYKLLLESDVVSSVWRELHPATPYFFFVPKEFSLEMEYSQYFHLPQVFLTFSTGVGTGKDDAFVQFDQKQVLQVASDLSDPSISEDAIGEKYGIHDTSGWNFTLRRGSLIKAGFQPTDIIKYHYRPFDMRFVFYNPIIRRNQRHSMKHLLKENMALLTCQQQSMIGFHHLLCTRWLVDESVISNRTRERALVLPLYLYSSEGEMHFEEGHRRPNLNPEFVKAVSEKLGLKFVEDGSGDLVQTFGPEDIFNYAYAVFHSPTYRSRYAEFLKIDFPRLPVTSNKELFKALAVKGAELVSLHLMESPALNNLITKYPIAGSNEVEKVSHDDSNLRVYINKTQYFEGVPPEVYNFHIGGYQVAQKWLKDRKGRTLTYDELTHYQKVIVALKETLRLMAGIDKLIPDWPME